MHEHTRLKHREGSMHPAEPTLVTLSSAVLSSNSSSSLNLISVLLKVLCVFMEMTPSATLTMNFGLITFPTWRLAMPTPA